MHSANMWVCLIHITTKLLNYTETKQRIRPDRSFPCWTTDKYWKGEIFYCRASAYNTFRWFRLSSISLSLLFLSVHLFLVSILIWLLVNKFLLLWNACFARATLLLISAHCKLLTVYIVKTLKYIIIMSCNSHFYH